jgi:hypothetical protein
MQKPYAIISLVMLLVLLSTVACYAAANPLPAPIVTVESPKNNYVYPTNTVDLHFTLLRHISADSVSFTYALDNQSPVETNGTVTLKNLPAGSHTITIYGKATSQGNTYFGQENMVVAIVYFSTEYSIAWIMVAAVTLVTAAIIPSSLYLRRRQIASRLKGKKTGVFWLGSILLALGAIVFVLSSWKAANDYLFPYWPKGITIYSYPLTAIFCIAFMAVGFGMMWKGTRGNAASLEHAVPASK